MRSDDYERFIENSMERIRILTLLQNDSKIDDNQKRIVIQAKNSYKKLAKLHVRRLSIYRESGIVDRASALMYLIKSGHYKFHSDPWGFTIAGLVKDMIATFFPTKRNPAQETD